MAQPTPAAAPQRCVLIVDDDRDILESFGHLVRKSFPNVRVLQAASGPDGLAFLRAVRVDVLLVDFRMPHMNGLEFLREAKAIAPTAWGILITAYPDMDVAIDARNEHLIRYYLTKPVAAETLQSVIAEGFA